MSIKACYNVQRSYNYEVSAYSTRHNSPSTPNKPVIRPEVDQKYPQISFSKKLKVAFKELDDENPRNSGESSDQNVLNTVDVVDWRKWLEKILEFPIEETRTQNLNPYTAKNKFEDTMIRYIGKVLMDFINKIIDIPGHVMYIDEIERDRIVNKISPLFTFLQATFTNKILFHWIEHDITNVFSRKTTALTKEE
ncbi:unnamed protein product [Rhizophagus irregularis]|nr:unnamed protein product [Rhizophagus irregularis]